MVGATVVVTAGMVVDLTIEEVVVISSVVVTDWGLQATTTSSRRALAAGAMQKRSHLVAEDRTTRTV